LLMPANRISTFSIIIFWILFLYLFSTYKYVGLEANLQRLKWYLWDNMKFYMTVIILDNFIVLAIFVQYIYILRKRTSVFTCLQG
jgi:hypothetical protein